MSLKIVLLGYMGSGKSTIGKLLASQISFSFFDLDNEIEKLENKSVNQLFKEKGDIYFRKVENEVLQKIINSDESLVLSLGGGTPCYFNTMDFLNSIENVETVYLDVTIPELADRLFSNRSLRPLIKDISSKGDLLEFIGKHLFERRQFYREAKTIISVQQDSPNETSQKIKTLLF